MKMRSLSLTPLLALAASVSAITITFPNVTDVNGTPQIDLSVPQTITWESVPSDPTSFKIALVTATQGVNTVPVQSIDIASDVKTADDKYTMQPPSGVTVNGTYQIFFYAAYNATTNGVIAESHDFTASKVGASSTTTGSSPTQTGVVTTISPTHNAGATLKVFSGAGVLAGIAMLFL